MAASTSSEQFVEKGRARHVKGDFDGALVRYNKALKIDPNNAEALHLMGVLTLQKGDPRGAVDFITKALTISGERGPYFSNLAAALLALGFYERAIFYIDRAVALGSISAEGATIRGEALVKLGQYDRALHQFEALYLQWPQHWQGLDGYIELLIMLERYSEMRDLLAKHLKTFGPNDKLLLKLGAAWRGLGDYQAALDTLAQMVNKDDPDWIVGTFKSLLELGRLDEAQPLGQVLLERKDRIAMQNMGHPFVKESLKQLKAALPLAKLADFKANVVCFSLWGSSEKYTFNAVLNAKLVPTLYPGWVARFYCDDTVPKMILDSLRDYGAQVIMVATDLRPNLALLWRFIACNDPSVGYFICRDCDSVVNIREKAAVDEWLASGKPFHIMRDHIEHAELMMAGMWGGVAGLLPDLSTAAVDYYETHVNRNRWIDQDFLRDRVWPAIKPHCLAHDDFYTMAGETRHFPTDATLPPGQHVGGYQERQWTTRATD